MRFGNILVAWIGAMIIVCIPTCNEVASAGICAARSRGKNCCCGKNTLYSSEVKIQIQFVGADLHSSCRIEMNIAGQGVGNAKWRCTFKFGFRRTFRCRFIAGRRIRFRLKLRLWLKIMQILIQAKIRIGIQDLESASVQQSDFRFRFRLGRRFSAVRVLCWDKFICLRKAVWVPNVARAWGVECCRYGQGVDCGSIIETNTSLQHIKAHVTYTHNILFMCLLMQVSLGIDVLGYILYIYIYIYIIHIDLCQSMSDLHRIYIKLW